VIGRSPDARLNWREDEGFVRSRKRVDREEERGGAGVRFTAGGPKTRRAGWRTGRTPLAILDHEKKKDSAKKKPAAAQPRSSRCRGESELCS